MESLELADNHEPPPTNSRKLKQDSERKYLYLVLFTLVIVGGFLIAMIFSVESLLTALPCLLAAAALIVLPWLALLFLQKWRDRLDA
ncbi:MAG: hypothetical protein R3293_20970 [Candidatus Promineifilaceae bacterium]|nr:hypothetical protein [Candidatus Promineifilaceae bacterium]